MPIVVVGIYARATGRTVGFCTQTFVVGVNSQIVLTAAAGLMVNPPRM